MLHVAKHKMINTTNSFHAIIDWPAEILMNKGLQGITCFNFIKIKSTALLLFIILLPEFVTEAPSLSTAINKM